MTSPATGRLGPAYGLRLNPVCLRAKERFLKRSLHLDICPALSIHKALEAFNT